MNRRAQTTSVRVRCVQQSFRRDRDAAPSQPTPAVAAGHDARASVHAPNGHAADADDADHAANAAYADAADAAYAADAVPISTRTDGQQEEGA